MADVHYLVGEDLALCQPEHPVLNWAKTRDRGAGGGDGGDAP